MDTLQVIGTQLIIAVKPLKDAVSSVDSFKQFLYRLGWGATGIPPSYMNLIAKIDLAVTDLEALADEPTVEEVLQLILRVKDVYDAIQNISDAPPGIVDVPAFLTEITERLFEILIIDYLSNAQPLVFNLFKLLGIIELQAIPTVPGRPSIVRMKIKWEEFAEIFAHPEKIPEKVFGWGTQNLNFERIAGLLMELFYAMGAPVSISTVDKELGYKYLGFLDDNPLNPQIRTMLKVPFTYFNIGGSDKEIGLALLEYPSVAGKLPGLILQPNIPSEIGAELRVREDIYLRLIAGSNIASLFGFIITPELIDIKYPFADGTLPDFGFGIGIDFRPASPAILLGSAGATRLEMLNAAFDFEFKFTDSQPEVILGFDFNGLALIIQAGESDGFIKSILGEGQAKLDLPLGLIWSSVSGVKFKGGGGFEVALHPHISLGPISIDEMQIRLVGDVATPPPKVKLEIGANIAGDLGPLQFVVQGIGISLQLVFDGGNAGPFGIELGFKPPNGIGLSIDTGVVKGGGYLYLDFEKGEYMGALELEVQNMFSLKAIGIINTKMPDGSDGFSLLIIITAEFSPIQLGFGFTLNGVGGLLGLNRTTKVEILREGVKTGTIKSILFPEDVVANINRIVSDLKQVFPIYEGHFIVGPMAKIGWGTPSLVTLELGLLLELPEPRIIILGVLKLVLPTEDADILKLQVNFLGVIDFENKYISFDASLFDSRLLIFTLTGDMALRISWGSPAVFILSVGGFHPAFTEAPPDLQNMTRLTISLLSGENPRITIQAYFAITSNTVQFGAKAELYAEACGFNVWGYIGFDVLFQFEPFKFIAEIYAGLALREGTNVLMGIRLRGSIAGPTPWDVEGEASFTILFFDITIHFHETWGDGPGAIETDKINVLELLKTEFNDSRNWKADLPATSNLHVTIKKIEPPEDSIVVHPSGVLSFSERLVPLDYTINKFGNKVPDGADRFSISDIKSDTLNMASVTLKELFAPANFTEMSDTEKISRKSFESMNSGFEVNSSSGLLAAAVVEKSVEYELMYLRKKNFKLVFGGLYKYVKDLFNITTKGSAVSQSTLSYYNNKQSSNAPDSLSVASEEYGIANVSDMKLYDSGFKAGSQAEVFQKYNELISKKPELKNKIQVLSTYEMNEV
ncbi:MAG: DUF6603 domain-containing protein [Ignavibacteria bacterium]